MEDQLQALEAFYNNYDPQNVPDKATLGELATKFAGKEKDLWKDLYGHYDPKNPLKDDDLNYLSSLSNPFGAEKKNGASPPVSSQPSETVSEGTPTEPVSPAEPPLAEDLGRIWDRFRQVGNETRVAAQQATIDKIEAQPLSRRMADWYANTLSPGARERVEEGRWTGDDVDINKLWHKVNSDTPEAAQIEAELQKIYKETDPADRRSLENAAIDAKQVMLSHMNPKTARKSWDDLAQTMANFEEYDPQGYHERLNKQIVERYKETGMDERDAYRNLMGATLDEGVMDEERTKEAQVGFQIMNWKDAVVKAVRKGDGAMVEFAGRKLEEAEAAERALRDQRLSAVDEEIGRMQYLLAMDSPPAPRADLRAEIKRLEGVKAGFINPDARIQAAYAKYETPAKQALPQGTPMEQLRKLYAEIAWDRKQVAKRIWAAEGGDGPVEYALKNMANSFGGGGHNADHRKLVQLDAQLKDLAPIVFLNESPAMQDRKAGFGPSAWNGLLNTIGGQGSPMSGTSRQEDALALARNLQIAGVAPEVLNDPSMAGISDRTREPGLRDAEYWGNLLGTSGGLMFHIMMAQQGTNALGMGSAINKLIGAEKYGGAILPLLGDAVESGLNYNLAGMASVDNKDELSFMGGFFGGAAGSLGKNGFDGAKKAVAGLFGDKGAEAARVIADFGAQRLGAGVGESFEETGQQLVQMWNQSNTGQEFWEKFGKQFGDVPELVKFYVSTMAMGMFMGGAHSDGLGKYMRDYAGDQLEGMPPLERGIAEDLTGRIEEEARDLIEGAQGGGGTQNEEEAPAMELTPEAQAAQEELEKSRKAAEMLGTGSSGRTIEDSVPEGMDFNDFMAGRMDEDIRGLERRLENPDLTESQKAALEAEIEQKRKARTGFEQMRDQTAFREVAPAPEVSTQTENIETQEGNVDNATPSNRVEIDGQQIELPTIEGLNTPQTPVSETAAPVAEPVEETPVSPSQETQQPPKRRDQEISDQINEFFNGLAGSIGEAAAKKIKEYADRIIAGESRESIIQNIPEKWVEAIDQAVELKRNAQQEGAQEETAVEQPAAEQSPAPIEVGNEIEYMQGPQSNRTKKKGKVTAIRPDGKYEVEIEVGGQKTSTVVDPRNVVQQETSPPVSPVEPVSVTPKKRDIVLELAQQGISLDLTDVQNIHYDQTIPSRFYDAQGQPIPKSDPRHQLALDTIHSWIRNQNQPTEATTEAITTSTEAQSGGETTQRQTTPPVQQPSIEMDALAVADLGRQVANALVEAGKYTRENWLKAMNTYGPIVAPHLGRAWQSVSRQIPEGTVKPAAKTTELGETGNRGTYDTFQEYEETNPDSVNEVLAAVDKSYERMNLKELFAQALDEVKKAGGFASTKVYESILRPVANMADKPLQQAKRMMAIRFYGEMADQLARKADEAETSEEKEQLTKLRDEAISRLDALMKAVAEENTYMGQATATMAEWRFLMENTVGYARAKIDAYNKKLMETPKGREIKRKSKEAAAGLNETRDAAIDGIENTQAVDDAITDVEEGKSKPKAKPRTKGKSALGLTRDQIRDRKEQALSTIGEFLQQRNSTQAIQGTPITASQLLKAVGDYGVAVMADGIITFKEWTARMRTDLPQVDPAVIQEAWDTHQHDGKPLSEHSREQIQERATPKPRTAAAKKGLRGKIRQAINDHFSKKKADGRSLEQRLVDDVDLTPEEAAYVVEAVQAELDARVREKVEQRAKALKRRPPRKKGEPRNDIDRAVEAMVDGAFTDEMVQEIFADRLGLARQMTPEEMARARALGKALSETRPGTRAEGVAALELDRFMYSILPVAKPEFYWEVFKSIVYSNMLMGLPTHLKNLASSGAMTASSFLDTMANVSKWKRALREAMKAKDISRFKSLLRHSPVTELAVKFAALGRGWAKGATIAWDIMKRGYMDSKFLDSQKAQAGRMSGILERHRFKGAFKAIGWLKYVGRALAAEDAWMYAINNEMELADAVRRHYVESSPAGGALSLTRDVHRRMARSNPLYQDSLRQAEQEIDNLARAVQMTPGEKARAIKIRAREILTEKLGLTEAEVTQASDIARSRVFTLKRNGIFGKLATQMARANAHKYLGKVTWIWMPFANIIGNLGDTFNDFFPVYGAIRANGLSPTALAQSLGSTKASAMMSDPVHGGAMVERVRNTMGGRDDQRYYEQMGRAWMGTLMLAAAMAAYALGDDDDDNDWVRFTGSKDPTHKNYLFIFGQPVMTWELIPPMAPVAAIMSESQQFHKAHPGEERSLWGRMLYAMGAVEQTVGGMSVAESVQNLDKVVGAAIDIFTPENEFGQDVPLDKRLLRFAGELAKSGINMVARANPLANPVIGQVVQIFDPRQFSHQTIEQSLEYAALGVFYRADPLGRGRMSGVDVFGEEIKRFPAEESFGFLSWAKERMEDPRWKFLADHGGLEVMSRVTNDNQLVMGDDDEVESRRMTEFQFGTYARLAGKKFSASLKDYMANKGEFEGNSWEDDYKNSSMTKAGKSVTDLQKKVRKMMSKAKSDAREEMNGMKESEGGFGGKLM